MDRYSELENLRRSLAMLPSGSAALDREAAMRLLGELQALEDRLRRLRGGIEQALADEAAGGAPRPGHDRERGSG